MHELDLHTQASRATENCSRYRCGQPGQGTQGPGSRGIAVTVRRTTGAGMCSLIRNPSTRAHLRLVCCFHPDAASPNAASRHAATAATAMADGDRQNADITVFKPPQIGVNKTRNKYVKKNGRTRVWRSRCRPKEGGWHFTRKRVHRQVRPKSMRVRPRSNQVSALCVDYSV